MSPCSQPAPVSFIISFTTLICLNRVESSGDFSLTRRLHTLTQIEEASFALEVGQMSSIVDSQSGSHIIISKRPSAKECTLSHSCHLHASFAVLLFLTGRCRSEVRAFFLRNRLSYETLWAAGAVERQSSKTLHKAGKKSASHTFLRSAEQG